MNSVNNSQVMKHISRLIVSLLIVSCAAATVVTSVHAETTWVPVGGGENYVFEKGDTLEDIADKFGITVKEIVKANGLRSSKRVIPGTVLTIPTLAEPDVVSPAVAKTIVPKPTDGKVIYISLGEQRMWAYDGDQLFMETLVSTGLPTEENPNRDTKPGVFRVKTKLPEAWAGLWGLRMPYWMGIYDSGDLENGIHAMPYTKSGRTVRWRVGTRGSYGCVVLNAPDMVKLYRWASFGTLVVIRS
jgi:lipoprotein-anchoring transpeptidase ErfK/SrfK